MILKLLSGLTPNIFTAKKYFFYYFIGNHDFSFSSDKEYNAIYFLGQSWQWVIRLVSKRMPMQSIKTTKGPFFREIGSSEKNLKKFFLQFYQILFLFGHAVLLRTLILSVEKKETKNIFSDIERQRKKDIFHFFCCSVSCWV